MVKTARNVEGEGGKWIMRVSRVKVKEKESGQGRRMRRIEREEEGRE